MQSCTSFVESFPMSSATALIFAVILTAYIFNTILWSVMLSKDAFDTKISALLHLAFPTVVLRILGGSIYAAWLKFKDI